jgi:hypothetical protein
MLIFGVSFCVDTRVSFWKAVTHMQSILWMGMQTLAVATLGGDDMGQRIDNLTNTEDLKRFYLQVSNFIDASCTFVICIECTVYIVIVFTESLR